MPKVLNLAEVAEYLRIHPSTVYRLIKKREIPVFKVGSDYRFNQESLDRWRLRAEDLAETAEKLVNTKKTLRIAPSAPRPLR
jgi:excisionase family DNA binding protein